MDYNKHMSKYGPFWLMGFWFVAGWAMLHYVATDYKARIRRKPQPAITGGLWKPKHSIKDAMESKYKHDPFFNTEYAGDTACFELIDERTIRLRCICPCSEYRKKMEKHKGVGD